MNAQETQDRREEIMVELSANELTVNEIAKEFGVSRQYVHGINIGMYGNIPGYNYPVRRMTAYPKEKYTDMEPWFEDCYEVKL
tara:strand:- start:133 stop:381 length:249 start_codon:yes stop_codon:yes gene_type:complete